MNERTQTNGQRKDNEWTDNKNERTNELGNRTKEQTNTANMLTLFFSVFAVLSLLPLHSPYRRTGQANERSHITYSPQSSSLPLPTSIERSIEQPKRNSFERSKWTSVKRSIEQPKRNSVERSNEHHRRHGVYCKKSWCCLSSSVLPSSDPSSNPSKTPSSDTTELPSSDPSSNPSETPSSNPTDTTDDTARIMVQTRRMTRSHPLSNQSVGIQQARLSPNESISRAKGQLRNHTTMSTEEASWLLQSASTVGRREGVTSSFSRLSLSQWIRQVESVVTQFVSFVWMLVKRLKLINRKGQTRLRREQRIGQTLLPKQASVGRRNDLADECCDHFTVVDVLMC